MSTGWRLPRPGLGSLLWILVLGVLVFRLGPQVKAAVGAGAPRDMAPAFQLRTLEGEPVSLERYRGQVVLVNFWATWCPPCRLEMPGFQRVYEDRAGDGFVVLALSTDRTGVGVVREFVADRGLTFPVAMVSGGVERDYGGVRALPTSFLIDREGRIRHEVKGIFAEPALRMAVSQLLAEPYSGEAAPAAGR